MSVDSLVYDTVFTLTKEILGRSEQYNTDKGKEQYRRLEKLVGKKVKLVKLEGGEIVVIDLDSQ